MKFHRIEGWGALRRAVLVSAVLLPAHGAFAMVKCVGSDGKVTFQDLSCDQNSTSVAVLQRFGQTAADAAAGRTKPKGPEPTAADKTPKPR